MKKLPIIITAIIMAVLMATLLPMQVFAAGEENSGKYISEVKIGVGKTAKEAEASLKGYTIVKNGDKYADLNEDAGGGIGSKGERVVYMGYKTTSDPTKAVTDLAVMNMKGGYSVPGYEFLMEGQIKNQIIPFVNKFLAAIKEYRANYTSKNAANKQRAQYIHDALNKYTDDDTGKTMGDLLLEKTKYELGDAAYNKLSADEKKNHADLITIIAQSNGRVTLALESLITRAADTGKTSWLDRLGDTSYNTLLDNLDMLPTDGKKKLAKLYGDDADKVMKLWEAFNADLNDYDNAVETVEGFNQKKVEDEINKYKAILDDENITEEEYEKALKKFNDAQDKFSKAMMATELVIIHDALAERPWGDKTMLDYFNQDPAKLKATDVYPLVASLSEGQRAGLDFVSLRELVNIGLSTKKAYKDFKLDSLKPLSIYAGVDRAIYQKDGVALTNDTLRTDALTKQQQSNNDKEKLGFAAQYLLMFSVGSMVCMFGSAVGWAVRSVQLAKAASAYLNAAKQAANVSLQPRVVIDYTQQYGSRFYRQLVYDPKAERYFMAKEEFTRLTASTKLCKQMVAAWGVLMVVTAAVGTVLAYRDLVNYYKVEFTPIPQYMVDEADITAYNAKGEKIVIKNQTAYYKAVECNRTKDDEMYKNLGIRADLNGDVGKQWLALYAAKNENAAPILASSLIAKTGSGIPSGYETGIHMFGSDSAFNLNDPNCIWNKDADKVFVYFNVDDEVDLNASGSTFNGGQFALACGIGLVAGALIMFIIMTVVIKKKEKA